ncbi:GNAT family N-acetyltransferase [Asticcacaulis machinosus]|uniref:N-acetyltransferase n=1 Tax=Asticcacaulis machinosus TaxID=2984211 RepID=A0ABT5HMY7_9CAUL|nr:N-acetyltransferase [Asticcacaulis machinosus]MDC7677532.1 N-acetyltransferase [Asticcacaulis machinosus]
MHILPITPDQVQALSDLAIRSFCDTFAHLYPPADLEAFLRGSYAPEVLAPQVADPAQFWRMAWADDKAVGYLHAGPVGLPHADADKTAQGEIKRLYIDTSQQGQGLGKQLLTIGLDYLSERYGNAPQWIGVWSENHRALNLYQSYGFEKVGEYGFPVGSTIDHEFILRKGRDTAPAP